MTDCFATSMQRAKAHMEKGDQSKEKADQHYISAGLELKVAKENLPAGLPWAKAVLDYGIHRTRANQLIRIADGRTTLEAERDRTRESVDECRQDGRYVASTPPLISQDNPELSSQECAAPSDCALSTDGRIKLTSAEQDQILNLVLRLLSAVDHPHRRKLYKHLVQSSINGVYIPTCGQYGWKGGNFGIEEQLAVRLLRGITTDANCRPSPASE